MIPRCTRPQMDKIWEDQFKFETWLKIEILDREAKNQLGQIPIEDLNEIR